MKTEGPNLNFYLALLIFGGLSIAQQSWRPLVILAVIVVLAMPISLLVKRLERRQGRQMLAEFPDDPYIQMKYAKYREDRHGS